MAGAAVDIRLIGDKQLIRALIKLPARTQIKVLNRALTVAGRRIHKRIIEGMGGSRLPVRTGFTLDAFTIGSFVRLRRFRDASIVRMFPPRRIELNISADDKWYYPWALEYGTKSRKKRGKIEAFRYIRDTVDEQRSTVLAKMRSDLGKGIEREARKLFKKR